MEKVQTYIDYTKAILSEIYEEYKANKQLNRHLIIDETTRQFLLLTDEWMNDSRFYGILIHIEIKENGRLWVHEDNTELIIVDKFLDKGVPTEDMVLGWHPPSMRPDTKFAVA